MKYLHLFIKWGPSIKLLSLWFSSWLFTFVVFTSSTLVQTNKCIKNSFSDNLTNSLLTTSSTKGKEKSIIVHKFRNYFSEKKLPLIENLRIKSLNCLSIKPT